MWKQIKFYTVLALILAPTGAALYLYYFGRPRAEVRRLLDPPALVQQIQQLNELVSVRYGVQKIIGLEEEKVPFGSESLVMMVRAEVLGGVDLAQLPPAAVTVAADKTVTIKLPPPRILHAAIDEKQTKVSHREKTWWTPWVPYSAELDQKARLLALESAQAAALEMGLLREAQQNAERAITSFLLAVGIAQVKFEPTPPTP